MHHTYIDTCREWYHMTRENNTLADHFLQKKIKKIILAPKKTNNSINKVEIQEAIIKKTGDTRGNTITNTSNCINNLISAATDVVSHINQRKNRLTLTNSK